MRAWRVDSVGEPSAVMAQQDIERPQPIDGELQISVSAAGIGLPDVLMCRGTYPFSPELPFTPGQEVAGVVTAVPAGSQFAPGDRVLAVTAFYRGHGGFAEYCVAPEGSTYPVPKEMSDVEAAGFGIPFHTAYVGLCLRGRAVAGETVLVHGAAGSSGSAAIQLARALGLTVIAVASTPEKRAWCASIGGHHCIDPGTVNFAESVLDITGGKGVDVVFDPVGGEAYEQSLMYCANGARILAVGFACGRWGELSTEALVLKNCSATGVFVGACTPDQMGDCHAELSRLYEAGEMAVEAGKACNFDQIPDALSSLASRSSRGKVVARIV